MAATYYTQAQVARYRMVTRQAIGFLVERGTLIPDAQDADGNPLFSEGLVNSLKISRKCRDCDNPTASPRSRLCEPCQIKAWKQQKAANAKRMRDMAPSADIHAAVKQFIDGSGMTQAQMSRRAGVPPVAISNAYRGAGYVSPHVEQVLMAFIAEQKQVVR